ncbi:MAG: hypothetical protein JST80_10890 [Bdellovibrionales bacterium]|nr:hypothetical protein [Bdellovibrionales bacterium]
MKNSLGISFLMLMSACSSTHKLQTSETQEDKVIARINEVSSRPGWLDEARPFQFKNGQIISLGQTTIPGDNRVEAAFRIAENNAKAAISGAIESRLEFIFQAAEEGTGFDSTQARYIGAEASKVTSSALKLQDRYWEKVATTQDNGQRVTQYKVFATVTMPEEDFRRAVIDAARKRQGKTGLSEDFSKKVSEQWDSFKNEDH